MYKTIIVPLDGLPFAAQAVATAAEIGKRCGADLILARVHEAYIYEDMDYALTEDNSRRDEEEYLADVAEWIESRYGIVPQ
jgi:nucleotide-binding universal stress UspA family protein